MKTANFTRAARLGVLALFVLAGCGGEEADTAVVDIACENSLMQPDGSIVLGAVESKGAVYQYTLIPATAVDGPRRYQATRAPATAAAACALSSHDGAQLQAEGISRLGQSVSIALVGVSPAQADGSTTFTVASARATGGNLDGFVGGDMVLAGAAVSVKSPTGEILLTGKTNVYGAIESELGQPGLPDAYRVVATGGSIDGVAIAGSLVADVSNYSADFSPVVTVTPITTLLSAWRDRNPGVSPSQTAAAVRAFLQFPEAQEMDSDHEASESYFDSAAFYAQARAAGSLDAFVNLVVSEWAQGTEHAFVPVEPVRGEDVDMVEKSLVPEDSLPMRAAVGAGQPQSLGIVVSLVGKLWESYESNQTKQFQTDTINMLKQIDRRLSDLKSRVDNNLLATKQATYATKIVPMNQFAARVRAAWDALTLLASYPDASAATKRIRILAIKNLTNGSSFSIPSEFRTEVRGSMVSNSGSGSGVFRLYREVAYTRASTPITPGTNDPVGYRNVFNYADSWAMWDNYQYWVDVQTIAYYFWAEAFRANGQLVELNGDATHEGLIPGMSKLLLDERNEMPRWPLNSGAHLDVKSEDYYGNPVGGPLVWFVAAVLGSQCPLDAIPFDPTNTNVRTLINARMACFNNPAHLGGVKGWRLPTFKEWEAFTLTAGRPGRDVGAWMEQRGVTHAKDLNGKFFYAQIGTSCSDSAVSAAYNQSCIYGGVDIYLANTSNEGKLVWPSGCTRCNPTVTNYWYSDWYQGGWEPFIWFNNAHNPGNWSDAGGKGYVIPVRAAGLDEFL
jgi:hypothetical protein